MRICFHFRVDFYKTAGVNLTLRRLYSVCHSETPDKESFSCFAKFLQNRGRDSGSLSRAENVREFHRVHGLGYMTEKC